jgi:hypothetical protein
MCECFVVSDTVSGCESLRVINPRLETLRGFVDSWCWYWCWCCNTSTTNNNDVTEDDSGRGRRRSIRDRKHISTLRRKSESRHHSRRDGRDGRRNSGRERRRSSRDRSLTR